MASSKRATGFARTDNARSPQAYSSAVRAQLADLQRARMLSAMVDVSCERGAGSVTVAHVVDRSGVSRRTFYEAFKDREDCFLAAFEQALAYASERVIPACDAQRSWREQIRAGVEALLAFLDEEPRLGRLLVSESLAGGPRALVRRAEVVAQLTREVDRGRRESKGASELPPLTSEGIVGGGLSVIGSRLIDEGHEPLLKLASPLVSMIVLPYLGASAAKRESTRKVTVSAPGRENGAPLSADPFKEAGMRLTYRTVRVLIAVAEHPAASNRLIGETAGITDQGQISKLLGRLERSGLVTNMGLHPGKGAPNSWTLTAKGGQVTQSIRAHTEGLE